jgi:predicted component of type VI protein secretion system
MTKRTVSTIVAMLVLVLTSAVGAAAQHEQHGQVKPQSGSMDKSKMMPKPAKGGGMMDGKMMEGCQEMKAQKQSMTEDMKSQDAQLTEQLAKMNRAPENEKMDLMAAALTQMVEQRITMDARKAQMEEAMMKHMMQHMQMGKEGMSQCPMMKNMHAASSSAHNNNRKNNND